MSCVFFLLGWGRAAGSSSLAPNPRISSQRIHPYPCVCICMMYVLNYEVHMWSPDPHITPHYPTLPHICPTLPYSNDSIRGKSVFGLFPVTSSSCPRPPPVLKAAAAPNAPLSVSTAEHARLCGFAPPRGLPTPLTPPNPSGPCFAVGADLTTNASRADGERELMSCNANGGTATMVQNSPGNQRVPAPSFKQTPILPPFLIRPTRRHPKVLEGR